MEHMWEHIKSFLVTPGVQTWIQHHLLYFLLLGAAIMCVLLVILIVKTNKDIARINREQRKRDKNILKFLSNKKNKTW